MGRSRDPGRHEGKGREVPRQHDREDRRVRRRARWSSYLNGETNFTPDELQARPCARASCSARFFPVLCGSSYKNKGVQPMLDAVCDYPAVAAGRAADQGPRHPDTDEDRRAQGRRQGAFLGADVQDPDRPVRRQADLLPRLLRHP